MGAVTASAYEEFFSGDRAPLVPRRVADVTGRAPRTVILVAVDGDRIIGSATLGFEGRTSDEAGPLAPDEAYIRMLGVRPTHADPVWASS